MGLGVRGGMLSQEAVDVARLGRDLDKSSDYDTIRAARNAAVEACFVTYKHHLLTKLGNLEGAHGTAGRSFSACTG